LALTPFIQSALPVAAFGFSSRASLENLEPETSIQKPTLPPLTIGAMMLVYWSYDTRPVHPEHRSAREPVGSPRGDGLCPGEPESEIHFLSEEQRESRLATGFFPFAPLPPRREPAGFSFALILFPFGRRRGDDHKPTTMESP
jgi:hypothetical protein